MKKIHWLALGFILVISKAFADSGFVVGANGLVEFPVSSSAVTSIYPGFGGNGFVGYSLDGVLLMGVESGYRYYPYQTKNAPGFSSGGFSSIPILATFKYYAANKDVKPYVLLGGGPIINSFSGSGTILGTPGTITASQTDFILSPGLGIAVPVSDKIDIYLESAVDILFTNNKNNVDTFTFNYSGGSSTFSGNLFNESSTVLIPIEVGANFYL